MKTISAKDAKNSFGSFLDSAQREPVMITKRDRPIGIFFSMQDIESLIQVSDSFKEEIRNGILAGVADVEAGRVKEFSKDYANDLKARVRAKLENNPNA
ncbi:MAG: type II toxin-antitoxin system prevent-host-death family antitoxin [Methylobacter sp.]